MNYSTAWQTNSKQQTLLNSKLGVTQTQYATIDNTICH